MAENKELKSFLMKLKEESEKVGFKLSIMASGPIIWWQIDGETMETMGASKVTVVSTAMKLKDACSLEEKLWPT